MYTNPINRVPSMAGTAAASGATEDAIRNEVAKRVKLQTILEQSICQYYEDFIKFGQIRHDPDYERMKAGQSIPAHYCLVRLHEEGLVPFELENTPVDEVMDLDIKRLQAEIERDVRSEMAVRPEEKSFPAPKPAMPQPAPRQAMPQPAPRQAEPLSDEEAERKRLFDAETERIFRESARDRNKCDWSQDYTDVLEVKSANESLCEAQKMPTPVSLYKTLWTEGEICILFADSGIGKTILAYQIAIEIAKNRRVLYFDFEMSLKQFEKRFTAADGTPYRFPDNLLRTGKPNMRYHADEDPEKSIIRSIEQGVIVNGCKILIIDNISYLTCDSADGKLAGNLMESLGELKEKYNLSMLVLAHTPKRSMVSALTQNDLAGSKKIMNFADAAFAIGRSSKDESMRYLKQVKVRSDEPVYTSDNVLLLELTTDDGYLHFRERGTANEHSLLREYDEKDDKDTSRKVADLRKEGLSIRAICDRLGLTRHKVWTIVKKMDASGKGEDAPDSSDGCPSVCPSDAADTV